MILVWAELDSDGLAETTAECLTFARDSLARDGEEVEALVISGRSKASAVRAQLARLGAAAVLHTDDERLASFGGAAWAAAIISAARARKARVVMASGTPRGTELMAHVATELDVAMAANVVAVEGSDPLRVSRQIMGGSILEEMQLGDDVAVLALAGHACAARSAATPTTPQPIAVDPQIDDRQLVGRVSRVEQTEAEDTSALTSAKVVVGGGRGVGGADGFDDLLELTELLGGALGVSRVVTNAGWRPHHEQVGQTGSRIAPDLYIACGISGAIQHWAGCQSAKTIVAINTDPDAPMVTRAHYAVIGDLHEVVPAVNEELRRRRG